jgi:hypothetical protein
MEPICWSETSVDTQRTTRRYIPEDGTLHNNRCENLKSYTMFILFIHVLLNEIVSSSDYITPNGRTISKYWIREDLEGRGRDVVWGTVVKFARIDWGS